LIVVAALALASIGIGWSVAGRMLRPIKSLADAAHEISETSLDRRIALDGPPDELKALADDFDAMLDRLERAFGAQRRFVADASHELRTPLATIRAELDALLADAEASDEDASRDELVATAARIAQTLDRADALVDALLTLSRSDAITAHDAVDLATLAEEVVTSTPGTSELALELSLEPAPVNGDATLLERLVANLVENAARYNRPGGLLSVATTTDDGASALVVSNDGPAIDPADLPSLTERFHRLAGARDGGTRGFGLGLAIADAIATGHGGSLSLTARPQGGLEARVWLPARHLAPAVDTFAL